MIEAEGQAGERIVEALRTQGLAARSWEGPSLPVGNEATALIIGADPNPEESFRRVKALRDDGWFTPVLLVGAQTRFEDRVAGLRAGADDYLVAPFALPELVARMEALLRRASAQTTRLRFARLEIDLVDRSVCCDARRVPLYPREFQLLRYLMRNSDQILTRETLYRDVWGGDGAPPTNVVDVCVGTLRRKLDRAGSGVSIVNIRKVGFRLKAEAPDGGGLATPQTLLVSA